MVSVSVYLLIYVYCIVQYARATTLTDLCTTVEYSATRPVMNTLISYVVQSITCDTVDHRTSIIRRVAPFHENV